MTLDKDYKKEYERDKDKIKFIGLKFRKKTDPEIIKKLESVGNMQGYIKSLILADIGKDEGGNNNGAGND